MQPSVFPSPAFPDYALLDSGEGQKLERFGRYTLRRPDPQALWRRRLPKQEWAAADLEFVRESDRGGRWQPSPGAPKALRREDASWTIGFGEARFVLRPTPFKHVGLFPEQCANWDYLRRAGRALRQAGIGRPRLLNLFGYTGAASILAAADDWEVTHVDASKASLSWLRDNMSASGLPERSIRLMCDDALAFAKREARRSSRYHAILLDPPHYGRGPKGERWQLEEGLAPLVEAAGELFEEQSTLVLSTYAVGYSPLAFQNLLGDLPEGRIDVGELAIAETGSERCLPAGFCARYARGFELEPA